MIELGNSLRAAREAKGLTVSQLAEMTRLAPPVVENLENENFEGIAAPIYGRGFIKLYCESVGLDPKPYIAEYMDIVSGVREPVIHERSVSREEPPPPAGSRNDSPEPQPQPPPEREPQPVPAPADEARPEEPPPADDLFGFCAPHKATGAPQAAAPLAETAAPEEGSFSRYAAPIRHNEGKSPMIFGRLGILALAAVGILALVVWGLIALFRMLSAAPAPTVETEAAAPAAVAPAVPEKPQPPAPEDAPKPSAPRTQQKIPDLFID